VRDNTPIPSSLYARTKANKLVMPWRVFGRRYATFMKPRRRVSASVVILADCPSFSSALNTFITSDLRMPRSYLMADVMGGGGLRVLVEFLEFGGGCNQWWASCFLVGHLRIVRYQNGTPYE
jgi:hypothetical protein